MSKRPPLGDEGLGSHPTAGESPAPKPHSIPGPTFIELDEIIKQHKAGTINERQAIVALARQVIELRDLLRDVMEANELWSGR